MDEQEQAEVEKAEEVTEYAVKYPTPVAAATELPAPEAVTLEQVEAANNGEAGQQPEAAPAPTPTDKPHTGK